VLRCVAALKPVFTGLTGRNLLKRGVNRVGMSARFALRHVCRTASVRESPYLVMYSCLFVFGLFNDAIGNLDCIA
jgi:hypothetical protein